MKFTKEFATKMVEEKGINALIEDAKNYYPKYPTRPTRPTLNNRNPTAKETREYADELERFEEAESKYHAERDRYDLVKREIDGIVEEMIKNETGFYNYVPADKQAKVWAKAWEDGHAYGFSEVYSKLDSLVELFS